MEELCERLINREGNIREAVAKAVLHNEKPAAKSQKELRPSVLFIDEVDVFFEKQFFGAIYQPYSFIKEDSFRNMLQMMWEKKKGGCRSYQEVVKAPEFTECLEKYSDWQELVKEQSTAVYEDLTGMDTHTDYKIKDGDKIGYLHRD